MISENVNEIRRRMDAAALRSGRNPEDIKLVAAVKSQGSPKIREAIKAGIKLIGHNYVQEAASEKPMDCAADVKFHMIGHVQRNKAKKAAELFDVIETVDDIKLLEELDAACSKLNKRLELMVQVNLAGEVQKSGISENEATRITQAALKFKNLKVIGLMTMPPFFDDPERARPYFARLRNLRDKLIASGALDPEAIELSMGMTGDFEAAIEEGATIVRIGTALFGPRLKPGA